MQRLLIVMLAWLFMLSAAWSPAEAQAATQHPALAQGTGEESTFRLSGLDSVNLFNGNLTLSVPLGSTYAVGGNLSYGLNLIYNSSAGWELEEPENAFCTDPQLGDRVDFSVYKPSILTNAGMGWTLSMGRLVPDSLSPATQLRVPRWTYLSPDGHRRGFFTKLHSTEDGNPSDVLYTNDGSYLRLHTVASDCRSVMGGSAACQRLEFPNGTFHEFQQVVGDDVTWRPTAMGDAFGNWVEIHYFDNRWEIHDMHGRVQTVDFEDDGQGRQRVDQVLLTAFSDAPTGNGTAVYDFTYDDEVSDEPVTVPWHQLAFANGEIGCDPVQGIRFAFNSVLVPDTVAPGFLVGLTRPDQSFFAMQYHTTETDNDADEGGRSGALERLTLPTGAVYEWLYSGRYGMRASMRNGTVLQPVDRVLGVARKLRKEDGDVTGMWTYRHEVSPYNSDYDPDSENIPCYHSTDVKVFESDTTSTPLLWDRHFFSSAQNIWNEFRGMGFTPCLPGDPDGINYSGPALSQQELDSAGNVLRETYVLYDHEAIPGPGVVGERNFRLRERVVEYHDDINADTDEPYFTRETWGYDASNQQPAPQEYDGLGHFRTYRFDSDFPGRNRREVYTRYGFRDGQLTGATYTPDVTDPWVLNTYDQIKTTEGMAGDGHVATGYFCFDADTGFLEASRTLKGNSFGSGDTLMRYEHEDGNVTYERAYGGDHVNLGDDPCSTTLAASYVTRHDYGVGVRKTTDYLDGTQVLHQPLRLTLDTNTGLPTSSRNAAGVSTDYVFDVMGRLVSAKLEGAASVFHEYRYPVENDTNRTLEHNVRTCMNGSNGCSGSGALLEDLTTFDRRGQRILQQRRMPSIQGGGSRLVQRAFGYDALGRSTFTQEWRDPDLGGFDFRTRQLDYDRFGRPAVIEVPDGSRTTFQYTGARLRRRSVDMAGPDGPQTSTVEELNDAKGRLIRVTEPSGAGGAEVRTTYEYDEGDRLFKICMDDTNDDATDPCTGQQRKFDYDDQGRLTQEEHPELGRESGSDAWIRYTYDAKGNMLTRSLFGDGLDRNYVYDGAGRLVHVLRPSEVGLSYGDRLLQEFFYEGPGNSACAGALVQSKQHQEVRLPGSGTQEHDVVVTETFGYDPDDACRLTHYGIRAGQAEGFRALRFVTGYAYDDLGNITDITYPDCGASPGCAGNTSQVGFGYQHGLLESVGGTADLTYHATGAVHTIDHLSAGADTVRDTYERSSQTWKPFSRITITGMPNHADWVYGPFYFDDAQNITRIERGAMGDETFAYDPVGRLVQSTVRSNGGARTQNLSYDVFGNLTQMVNDGQTTTLDVDDRNRLGTSHVADYDVAGSVTGLRLGAVDYSYQRDRFHRILRLVGAGAHRSFLYTTGGERFAAMDLLGDTTQWTVRGVEMKLLSTFSRQGELDVAWSKDYMHGAGKQLAAALPNPSGGELLRHFHLDHLGTTRLVTEEAQVITENTFYPFGGYTQTPTSGTETLQFTGHERDDLGGNADGHLDYMHARYYTPGLGRFLSVDPISSYDPKAPQSWNRYGYVLNNPMSGVDPTGEATAYVFVGIRFHVPFGSTIQKGLRKAGFKGQLVDNIDKTGGFGIGHTRDHRGGEASFASPMAGLGAGIPDVFRTKKQTLLQRLRPAFISFDYDIGVTTGSSVESHAGPSTSYNADLALVGVTVTENFLAYQDGQAPEAVVGLGLSGPSGLSFTGLAQETTVFGVDTSSINATHSIMTDLIDGDILGAGLTLLAVGAEKLLNVNGDQPEDR